MKSEPEEFFTDSYRGEGKFIKYLKMHWKKILVIITIIGGIISNQLIHPLFFPRVNKVTVEPLFIQLRDDNNKFYTVFKVNYHIDVPLFPLYKVFGTYFNLDAPGFKESTDFPKCNIFWLGTFYANQPYVDLPEKFKENWVNLDEINGKIQINLPLFFNVKSVEFSGYLAEETVLREQELTISNYYWWNYQCIDSSQPYAITRPEWQLLGYGEKLDSNTLFRFYEVRVKNLNNLEVRGYRITLRPYTNSRVCYDFYSVEKIMCGNNDCISIDLEPKETKKFLVLEIIKPEEIKDKNVKLNFTSETICFGAWKRYLELLSTSS